MSLRYQAVPLLSLAMLAAALGCTSRGTPGSQGPTGPTGPAGFGGPGGGSSTGGGSGGGFQCAPNAFFCDGNTLWRCTRIGLDAYEPADCTASGSPTNPGVCSTSNCPNDAGACCGRTKPVCAWDLTAPFPSTGDSNSTPSADVSCDPPGPATCAGSMFMVIFSESQTCGYTGVVLAIDRTKAQPGTTFNLPGNGGYVPDFGVSSPGRGGACSGTVDWVSDAPDWKVQFNATCGDSADGGIALVGALSGTI